MIPVNSRRVAPVWGSSQRGRRICVAYRYPANADTLPLSGHPLLPFFPSPQEFGDTLPHRVCSRYAALPNSQDSPTHSPQPRNILPIPLGIPFKFWPPIPPVALRNARVQTSLRRMLVPKTPMHEYHALPSRKHKVWLARQIPPVQPESTSHRMHKFSNNKLRRRPLAPDTAHVLAPAHSRDRVSHRRRAASSSVLRIPRVLTVERRLRNKLKSVKAGVSYRH